MNAFESASVLQYFQCTLFWQKKSPNSVFECNCYHKTFLVLRDTLNSISINLRFVKEQVLHWDEAEPRPAGRSDEALLRSRRRETHRHAPAWVHIKHSLLAFCIYINLSVFICFSQLFLKRLIPCRFKSSHQLWRVLWKVFMPSGQVRGISLAFNAGVRLNISMHRSVFVMHWVTVSEGLFCFRVHVSASLSVCEAVATLQEIKK